MKVRNFVSVFLFALTISVPTADAHAQQAAQSPEATGQSVSADPTGNTTPDYALRKFMLATCSGDLKVLKKFSYPHDDIEVLLPTEKLPDIALKQMQGAFETMPIKSMKVGDSMKLPSGESVTFDASHIDENHAVLTFANNPLPIPAVRIEGKWKINPTKMIAVRKAAKRLMQQQRENALQSTQEKGPE